MSTIIFITAATAKPEKEIAVRQALIDVAIAARANPDCIEYSILQSSTDPASTINFERWSSEEARDQFNSGPDVEKFIAIVSGNFTVSPQPASYLEIS